MAAGYMQLVCLDRLERIYQKHRKLVLSCIVPTITRKNNNMKIIGLTGLARSGKDSIAKYLWAQHEYTRIAFADPLKMAAQHIFGLTDEQTWSDDLKAVVIDYWGMSPRQMFQKLGTEAIKGTFGANTWAKRWELSYGPFALTDDVVVPDVRTDVEAALLRYYGGVIIEVSRKSAGLSGDEGSHSSESGLSTFAEFEITNDGTMQDLHEAVDAILGKLG